MVQIAPQSYVDKFYAIFVPMKLALWPCKSMVGARNLSTQVFPPASPYFSILVRDPGRNIYLSFLLTAMRGSLHSQFCGEEDQAID